MSLASSNEKVLKYNFEEEEEVGGLELTCWQKFRFFLKQSCKDICRHKCQFCLSFCSVFVVVLSVLVVNSITKKGPIIFLSLSEKSVGQFDGVFSNRHELCEDFNVWFDNSYYIDFQTAKQVMADNNKDYNLSPRMQFCGAFVDYKTSPTSADNCLMFMDTQREKDIGIGPEYPFDPLAAGECNVPTFY